MLVVEINWRRLGDRRTAGLGLAAVRHHWLTQPLPSLSLSLSDIYIYISLALSLHSCLFPSIFLSCFLSVLPPSLSRAHAAAVPLSPSLVLLDKLRSLPSPLLSPAADNSLYLSLSLSVAFWRFDPRFLIKVFSREITLFFSFFYHAATSFEKTGFFVLSCIFFLFSFFGVVFSPYSWVYVTSWIKLLVAQLRAFLRIVLLTRELDSFNISRGTLTLRHRTTLLVLFCSFFEAAFLLFLRLCTLFHRLRWIAMTTFFHIAAQITRNREPTILVIYLPIYFLSFSPFTPNLPSRLSLEIPLHCIHASCIIVIHVHIFLLYFSIKLSYKQTSRYLTRVLLKCFC